MKKFTQTIQLITFLHIFPLCLMAQPTVNYGSNVSSGCSPLLVNFTSTSTGSGTLTYLWDFDNGQSSTQQNPVMTFTGTKPFAVKLTVTDNNGSNSLTKIINVEEANADFKVTYSGNPNSTGNDFTMDCYASDFVFEHADPFGIVDTGGWNYGDNEVINGYKPISYKVYSDTGTYLVKLFIETSLQCMDTVTKAMNITGPAATIGLTKTEACPNEEVTLFVASKNSDVASFDWLFDDGQQNEFFDNIDTVFHFYQSVGSKRPVLTLYGPGGCTIPVGEELLIREVVANFTFNDTAYCDGYPLIFTNTSLGANSYTWNFGDGQTSTNTHPQHTYSTGNYTVELIVGSAEGCADSANVNFEIRPIPDFDIMHDTLVCIGNLIQLYVSGGDEVVWKPADGLNDVNSYTPIAQLLLSQNYSATVRDTLGNCKVSGSISIFVQQHPDINGIALNDTTVGVGEPVVFEVDSNIAYSYNWLPTNGIYCTNCATTLARPITTTEYTLVVSDTNNCFNEEFPVKLTILEDYHIELPSSFSPELEGNNIIFVKGWGLEELIEYRIYNRQGQEVYSGNQLSEGWDGTTDGKSQPTDAYAYFVKAKMLDGRILEKRGSFNLFR